MSSAASILDASRQPRTKKNLKKTAIPQEAGSDDEFGDESGGEEEDELEEDGASGSDDEDDEDGRPEGGEEFRAVAADPAAAAPSKKQQKKLKASKRGPSAPASNKDAALAKAFAKIMEAPHARTGPSAVLAASKSVLKRTREDDEASAKAASARKARAELLRKRGHAPVPARGEDPEHDAREKALSKLATRGVVALFNAVSTAQRRAREAEAAGAKAATATAAGKAGFLAALRGSAVAAAVAPHAGAARSGAPPPSAKGWDVLHPGYDTLAGGRKMKDWDRRREEDEAAKGAGPVGDALSSEEEEEEEDDGDDDDDGDEGGPARRDEGGGRSSSSDGEDDGGGGGGW